MASRANRISVTCLVQERIKNQGNNTLLWQNLLMIKDSEVVENLDPKQVELQEQKYELVHTEASYNLRLELLREHFYENTQLKDDLPLSDYKILFSNIKEVKICSDNFLADLENIWQDDIFLKDIFNVVLKHCSKFSPYIRYCKDGGASIDLLYKRIADNPKFAALVNDRCERFKEQCSIPLGDMLGLPRTRLPTMIPAIERALSIIRPDDAEYETCRQALSAIKQLTNECDESIRVHDDIVMLLELRNTLIYPLDMPLFPLAVTGRCLDTKDVFTYHEHISVNLQERAKPHPQLTVMLFNDFLLILEQMTRKSDDKALVKDYCLRNMADVIGLNLETSDADGTHTMLLRIKENSRKQHVDMLLSTKLKATRDWWVSRFTVPSVSTPAPLTQIPPHVPVRSSLANPPTASLPSVAVPTRPITVATTQATSQEYDSVRSSRISRFAEEGGYVKNPEFVPIIDVKDEKVDLRHKSKSTFYTSLDSEPSLGGDKKQLTSSEKIPKKPEREPAPAPDDSIIQRPRTLAEDTTGEWTEKLKEMMELNSEIEFSKEIGNFALLSGSRWLVKSGGLTQYPQQPRGMSLFKAKPFKCEFLLFNDILLLSKAKRDGKYVITNYCKRNLVKISKAAVSPHILGKAKAEPGVKFVLVVTFIENHEKKRDDLVFSCDAMADTDAWVEIFEPPKTSVNGEIIFYPWDCPVVRIVRDYEAQTHTELTVNVDEEISIIRKCKNGMYEGERLSDHLRGFFPSSVTLELPTTEYARAKGLREEFDRTNFPS